MKYKQKDEGEIEVEVMDGVLLDDFLNLLFSTLPPFLFVFSLSYMRF